MKTRIWKRAIALTALMTMLFFGLALASSSVTLDNYQIDFLGATQNGTESTWTYAITADGDELKGLSHWTLSVGSCATIVSPAPGQHTTSTDHPSCGGTYNCQAGTYTEVQHGYDPTTGVSGIKFGDSPDQLSSSNTVTHIFEITLDGVFANITEDIQVATKPGGGRDAGTVGFITGASCGAPSAVTLSSSNAQSDDNGTLILSWLTLVGILSVASLIVLHRSRQLLP